MPPELDMTSTAFSDADFVARYAEGPSRMVPGFADMQRMTAILLAERVPEKGRVLVLGAGGGLELKVFAEAYPSWTFEGIDPSREMLRLAEQTLGVFASRARLHQGLVESATAGPFDAATCLLTMHFMSLEERLRTLAEIHRRLKPGAPLVVVHYSLPSDSAEREVLISRFAAFAISSGLSAGDAQRARTAIERHLTILPPQQDEAILEEAGFANVNLFYAGFAFRGWVAYA